MSRENITLIELLSIEKLLTIPNPNLLQRNKPVAEGTYTATEDTDTAE